MRTYFITLSLLIIGEIYPHGLIKPPIFIALVIVTLLVGGFMMAIAQDVKELTSK